MEVIETTKKVLLLYKEQMNTSTKNNENLEVDNSSDGINEYNNGNERKLF